MADWADRLDDPLAMLAPLAVDRDSQLVRLEGVRALAAVGLARPEWGGRAAELALAAYDLERDDPLDYAVWLAARELAPHWVPAVVAGRFDDGGQLPRVLHAVRAAEAAATADWLVARWRRGDVAGVPLIMLLDDIALLGTADHQRLIFDLVTEPATPEPRAATLLGQQLEAHRARKVIPTGDLSALARLLGGDDATLVALAIEAAVAWQVESAADEIEALAAAAEIGADLVTVTKSEATHGGLGQARRRLPSPRVRAGAVLVVHAPARIARALEVHGTLLANHEVSRGRAVSAAVAWPR